MSGKFLAERDVIRLMREAYDRHLNELMEIDISPFKGQTHVHDVVDIGTKVRHKKTNLLYTVVNITDETLDLLYYPMPSEITDDYMTNEYEILTVTKNEFKKEYRLD